MSAQAVRDDDQVWRLSGTLDFESVRDLYARTDELLGDGGVIDLSGIEASNSAGVALLLEWRRQAHLRGVVLELRALPESVRRVARLSDVEALLAD